MMSGFTRPAPETGPREEPRSVVALQEPGTPSQPQSMKRLLALAASLPPTGSSFSPAAGAGWGRAPRARWFRPARGRRKLGFLRIGERGLSLSGCGVEGAVARG